MKCLRTVCVSCWLCAAAAIAQAGSLANLGIGAYGDSMTMQYSFWLPLAPSYGYNIFSNGTQLNWVDQLVRSGYNVGPLQSVAGGAFNSYDAGVVGYTTSELVPDNVPYLQPHVASGAVSLVVQIMGANDFGNGEYAAIYNNAANHAYNPLADPAVISFENNVINNIAASIAATRAENPQVHMVLATIPDIGVTPKYRSTYPSSTQRSQVTQVVNAVNARIVSLAASYGFPVVDLFGLANQTLTLTTFAGLTMVDAGGQSGKDMFLSDSFHPGTVLQGILANAILQADQVAYGDTIAPNSDQQIATWAGLTPTGPHPTYFNVSPYVSYTALIPEPPTAILAGLGIGCLLVACVCRGRMAVR